MAKQSSATRLVRLKPYDPRRGCLMRTYVYGGSPSDPNRGKVFREESGWYKVDAKLATYLETVLQVESDPLSQPAFDVKTAAEAAEIDKRERKSKVRADANEANDLTTADLRRVEGRTSAVDAAGVDRPKRVRPSRAKGAQGEHKRSMV
jgi:hypothetical protein